MWPKLVTRFFYQNQEAYAIHVLSGNYVLFWNPFFRVNSQVVGDSICQSGQKKEADRGPSRPGAHFAPPPFASRPRPPSVMVVTIK